MKKLALILAIFPQILFAQMVVDIRSGEHDGFTRLVLTVDPNLPWELVETRGMIDLVFPDQRYEFDTTEVFTRIAKNRVSAISGMQNPQGSTLKIETPCACAANVFPFGQNYLVIDIADGGPLPEIAVQENVALPPGYDYWQPALLGLAPAQGDTHFFAPPPMVVENLLDQPPHSSAEIRADIMLDLDLDRSSEAPSPAMLARIEEAQDQLLQQLTRAADQGLLEFVTPVHDRPEEAVDVQPESPTPAPSAPSPDPELLRQLSARTAYDSAAESDLAEIVNEFAKPQCLDDSLFDMTDWGGDAGFSEQVALSRANLYGEFDMVIAGEIDNLAKLYLVNGLGAEAIATLTKLSEQPENAALMIDLARILDGESWQGDGPVAKGENCGGDHEMWFLAGSTGRPDVIDTQPVIEAFSRYPIAIRLLIGPRIANTLLDAGEFNAANDILELVRRAAGPETVPMQMASANLLVSEDNQAAALRIFEQVAQAQESDSPDAVINIARAALAQESGIPNLLLTDLQAIAFAQRDTPLGAEARLWEIRVAARINGMNDALKMIAEDLDPSSDNSGDLTDLAIDIMLENGAKKQGDMAYIQAVLAYKHLLPVDGTADAARIHIANELNMVGLPNVALEILTPALLRQNQLAKQSAARAYLAQFEPANALMLVDGDQSDAAIEIALAAYLLAGDHSAIIDILSDPANAGFVQGNIAWRAGDWENVSGDTATFAAFMQGDTVVMDGREITDMNNDAAFLTDINIAEKPNLQTARDLLAVNRASREYIEEVLAESQGM